MKRHILEHFRRADPALHAYFKKVGPVSLEKSNTFFSDLCDAIISQQLSEKAGATIVARFFRLFNRRVPKAELILNMPDEKMRGVGMSRAKVLYVKALAEAVTSKKLQLKSLEKLSDTEVIQALTAVKGIGPWTAEMFLIFSLGREDVFSIGDLGLRRAI